MNLSRRYQKKDWAEAKEGFTVGSHKENGRKMEGKEDAKERRGKERQEGICYSGSMGQMPLTKLHSLALADCCETPSKCTRNSVRCFTTQYWRWGETMQSDNLQFDQSMMNSGVLRKGMLAPKCFRVGNFLPLQNWNFPFTKFGAGNPRVCGGGGI